MSVICPAGPRRGRPDGMAAAGPAPAAGTGQGRWTAPATRRSSRCWRACRSARDRLIVLLMARAGLRRGEVCGLRRSDVHLLPDSRRLGCEVARAHLHVVRREDNPNGAWAKSRRQRAVPLDFLVVQAFDTYEFERMRVPAGSGQRFRAGQLVPRADRCADAPGRGRRAARGGLPPGRAGHPGQPASAAARLRQQCRRCRAPASMWSLTCSDTRDLLLQVYVHPDPRRLRAAVDAGPARASMAGRTGDRHGTGHSASRLGSSS